MERIIPATQETRVYLSDAGHVCIKQINPIDDEGDLIILPVAHVDTIIKWLQEVKQEAMRQGKA